MVLSQDEQTLVRYIEISHHQRSSTTLYFTFQKVFGIISGERERKRGMRLPSHHVSSYLQQDVCLSYSSKALVRFKYRKVWVKEKTCFYFFGTFFLRRVHLFRGNIVSGPKTGLVQQCQDKSEDWRKRNTVGVKQVLCGEMQSCTKRQRELTVVYGKLCISWCDYRTLNFRY